MTQAFRRNLPLTLLGFMVLAFGAYSGITLHFISTSLKSFNQWSDFLTWRFPFTLTGPTLLIILFLSLGLDRQRNRCLQIDLYSYVAVFPALLIAGIEHNTVHSQWWFGAILLGLLAFKAWNLARFLLFNQHPSIASRTNLAFFLSLVWFFSAYALWITPVHKTTGDEPHYLLMTHSLINDGDLNLYDEYKNREYFTFYDDILEPKPSDTIKNSVIKSVGLGPTYSIFLIPGYLAFWIFGRCRDNGFCERAVDTADLSILSRILSEGPPCYARSDALELDRSYFNVLSIHLSRHLRRASDNDGVAHFGFPDQNPAGAIILDGIDGYLFCTAAFEVPFFRSYYSADYRRIESCPPPGFPYIQGGFRGLLHHFGILHFRFIYFKRRALFQPFRKHPAPHILSTRMAEFCRSSRILPR
jgi:hypothetical protein